MQTLFTGCLIFGVLFGVGTLLINFPLITICTILTLAALGV